MSQVYHENAKLNKHSREIIQESALTNVELSTRFGVNEKRVRKWKGRDFQEDKSSRPETIHCDNGLEFTDKFAGKEKKVSGNHIFDKLCKYLTKINVIFNSKSI